MTMPNERTRCVIQTAEFLKQISRASELPDSIRAEAKRLLRHFPSADEIHDLGRFEEHLENSVSSEPNRELLIHLHNRMFSSS